jgi:hypothetical protein
MRSGYAWAQGHLLVFAGIAATAVGLEFMIEAAADGRDLELADRLPLGAGVASYLVAIALIRSATRRWDWVVGLRPATGGAALARGRGCPTSCDARGARVSAGRSG